MQQCFSKHTRNLKGGPFALVCELIVPVVSYQQLKSVNSYSLQFGPYFKSWAMHMHELYIMQLTKSNAGTKYKPVRRSGSTQVVGSMLYVLFYVNVLNFILYKIIAIWNFVLTIGLGSPEWSSFTKSLEVTDRCHMYVISRGCFRLE